MSGPGPGHSHSLHCLPHPPCSAQAPSLPRPHCFTVSHIILSCFVKDKTCGACAETSESSPSPLTFRGGWYDGQCGDYTDTLSGRNPMTNQIFYQVLLNYIKTGDSNNDSNYVEIAVQITAGPLRHVQVLLLFTTV